jgi:Ribonuclease G/E
MEVTRKRVRVNLMTEKTELCPVCHGGGRIPTLESTLGMIDRWLARARAKGKLREVTLVVSTPLVDVFCKDLGRMFHYLEYKHGMKINAQLQKQSQDLGYENMKKINHMWFGKSNKTIALEDIPEWNALLKRWQASSHEQIVLKKQ